MNNTRRQSRAPTHDELLLTGRCLATIRGQVGVGPPPRCSLLRARSAHHSGRKSGLNRRLASLRGRERAGQLVLVVRSSIVWLMRHEPRDFTVLELVQAWKDGDLVRNDEYQRGTAWTEQQKQGLIDSIFRMYPIPPLFLHRIVRHAKLSGNENTRFEIVDGQQRIRALLDYLDDKFTLLTPTDRKLRLPSSMRGKPAPWGGQRFKTLSGELRKELENTQVRAYILDAAENDDEVRDLFIRLQAGTALGRQQIRDAWPGNVGPFIVSLAGKMNRRPSCELFTVVDQRGQRGDDEGERDDFVGDRQICAQLLRIFMTREADPRATPSVSAGDLDAIYHEHPDFQDQGSTARRFVHVLEHAEHVFQRAIRLRRETGDKCRTFRKLEVFALVNLLQDLTKNPDFKVTTPGLDRLAKQIVDTTRTDEPKGRTSSGRAIAAYYDWWRDNVAADPGVRLDPLREFTLEQKSEIFSRDGGLCQICQVKVEDGDAEYDHFPIPHRDGGRTELSNGRLVHRVCHPRGRPPTVDIDDL